jgi:hypothetical protein
MTETQYLTVKPGATLRILSEENNRWVGIKPLGSFSAKEVSVYEYPTTARRAFVNLAEAVRTSNDAGYSRRILEALAGIHVNDSVRDALVAVYVQPSADGREALAEAFAAILDGHEKFDTARFIHHATSDSTADNDGESGKWSYNRTHQAEAQKTTIESIPEDGDGETVIL